MSGITEDNEKFGYCKTFQKILYRLYKTYNLKQTGFFDLLDNHYKHYLLLTKGKISQKHYFDICWIIADKLNKVSKEKEYNQEMKQDIKNLYGGIRNRQKEEGLYEK